MGNSKIKTSDRILALLLSLIMFIGLVPITVSASTEANPGVFTVVVKDGLNADINGATVAYDIKVNGISNLTGSVTTAGGEAVIADMAGYAATIVDGVDTVSLDYTVSKFGYTAKTGTETIADATGNINIVLTEMVMVSIASAGNGTVKLNGAVTNWVTVDKGSNVSVELIPATNCYIKSLFVKGVATTVTKGESYSASISDIQVNIGISVEFVQEYTVSVSSNAGGSVLLDNESVTSKKYDENSNTVISATADDGYQIAAVSIGGVAQTISDVASFNKTVSVTADTAVAVAFVKVYTVTVTSNENGTAVTDPAYIGGKVIVNTGTDLELTATPNETFRISKIVVNGAETAFNDNTYNNTNPYVNTYTVDKDYSIEITFAPLQYNVTITDSVNGSASTENHIVNYDGSATVSISPAAGYTVDAVQVNGVNALVNTPDDTTATVVISNIRENKEITVTFKTISSANMSDVSLNNADVARANSDGTFYVFKKDATVTFSTAKEGIRINGVGTNLSYKTQSVTFDSATTITKIELYYKADGDLIPAWHTVSTVTDGNPLNVTIDTAKPEIELTPETANANGYYNSNVSVVAAAKDNGDYSGIGKVEYEIYCDGTVTESGTLYLYESGSEVLNSFNGNIIVPSAANNSDDVVVKLIVTDRAGNIETTTRALKINESKPVVGVSIDGTLHAEATEGYYNTQRRATVTIVDRATTFDEIAANNGITITAKNAAGEPIVVSKATMIGEWVHDGDTHTASILFDVDANYTWEISYTNKAGVSNNGVAATGSSVYAFAVDKTAPTGSVSIEANSWNSMLSALTFGLWKNYSVTANGSGDDAISPVYGIKYYKSNSDDVLTEADLIALYNDGKFTSDVYTVNADEQFAVYARITDYAGNTLYIGSNGVVVDLSDGVITLTPDTANEKGFYNDDVNVAIDVNEEAISGAAYSGIKTVDYQVIKDKTDSDSGIVTQSGNLYTFDISDPTKAQLRKEWSGSIVVDKNQNNSDNIKVLVIVKDNAGNEYSKEITLAINIDSPTIEVSFDGNNANKTVEGRGYFGAARTATITIVDRATAFNAAKATAGIVITAVNANGEPITLDTAAMISDWNHNGKIHTATVVFAKDGNYSWSLSYTNDADNANSAVTTGTSVTPFTFTVDTENPAGTITVNANTWDKILSVLTFGLYSNVKADITATAEDATSPVTIEYYKTSNATIMTAAELDSQRFAAYSDFSIENDEQFVVYLKITDHSGNYIYINSDGYIVDKTSGNIVLTPEAANGFYGATANSQDKQYGIYNGNLNVAVAVTDASPYSGIKTVDYRIVKDNDTANPTQSGNLYTFDIANPTQSQLTDRWEGNIAVDSALNNSCNVVVYVRMTDNAGNENTQSVKLDLDIVAPAIDITFDNNTDNNGNTYFDATRMATVVITERTHHFDAAKATNGIVITAVDVKGNNVENAYSISGWTTQEGATPDSATHTATVSFTKDANYTFAIGYTDEASNANTAPDTHGSVAPYKFTVDTTSPTGTVKAVSEEGREREWSELNNALTFGFWSNKKITISGTSDDVTSPVVSVMYYKLASISASDNTTALTVTQLDAVTEWDEFTGFDVAANEQFTVYIKITDNAGNYTYISTNGLIVDDQHPIEESIAPEITVTPEQPINGIYNGDVKVSIRVDDPLAGGTYSGLTEISYAVYDRAASTTEPTQSGILYTFTNTDPLQSELLKTWSGEIIVDSALNNSNDIRIVVYARDNSQNTSDDFTTIMLDTTAPVIDISYDNNTADGAEYFKNNRTATIVVTERNFNADDVKLSITNTDGVIPSISSWTKAEGSGNLDDTKWTATIEYTADGDYTFGIEYTDLADNICTSIVYATSTVAGTEFTLDKTIPIINVSYDNNSAQNTNYYKAERTATIVITEHNFSSNRVRISLTATDDGTDATIPTVSEWTASGDKHTATIHYSDDSLYTFDIEYSDLAGNDAADFTEQTFFVDKTLPALSITGVLDSSANNGDVIPIVTYSDTNYNSENVTITLNGANRGSVALDGNYSDIHNGRVFTFNNFAEEKDIDDIYTLTATLTDRAGNTSTQTITFSVNRFGSTYALGESATAMNGSFVKEATDIVVTETNANECTNIKITMFKNDQTIVLKENTDYEIKVDGGNGGWFMYTYTVFKKNFEDDGVYRLTIHSEDEAGNVAENTLDTKDKEISFGVDKTTPNTVVNNLESEKTYPLDTLAVVISATDNLNLTSVTVYLDGSEYKTWNAEDIQKLATEKGDFTFDIGGDSTNEHNVRVVSTDAAGNETVTEISGFYVTTNLWVRYYNNKLLFFGSIGGILLIAAGLVVLITIRKRRAF